MKKVLFMISIVLLAGMGSSCVRTSKRCKKNSKKVKSLRKSGALQM